MIRLAALGLALVACGLALLTKRPAGGRSDWVVQRPSLVLRTGTFDRDVDESSGVAASARHPGLFWTVLDSGNEPHIIAIDSAGRVRGRVELGGAANEDWEAVGLGPCPGGTCVYVGDIGDNVGQRRTVVVYRLPEPDSAVLERGAASRPAEGIRIAYPGGGRDAEAMIVTPSGDLILVTKGLASSVRAFRVPASAWTPGSGATVTAEDLGPLPISPRTAIGRWVTDAAIAPDGHRVAVRTYRDIFLFVLGAEGGLAPSDPPTLCDISGLESQGEGIGWANDSTMILTSEGSRRAGGSVHYVRCAWP